MTKQLSKYVCGEMLLAPVANDGSTHINIYSNGITAEGRLASNFCDSYTDTSLGKFRTLEGLYHTLRIAEYMVSTGKVSGYDWNEVRAGCPELNVLLTCSGTDAIRYGRELKKQVYGGSRYKPGAFSKQAEFIFVSALIQKLHDMKVAGVCLGSRLALLVGQGIPLTHYYVYSGKAVWPPHFEWLPELIAMCVEHIDPYGDTFSVADVTEIMRGVYGIA